MLKLSNRIWSRSRRQLSAFLEKRNPRFKGE
jgi:hypothetical protein